METLVVVAFWINMAFFLYHAVVRYVVGIDRLRNLLKPLEQKPEPNTRNGQRILITMETLNNILFLLAMMLSTAALWGTWPGNIYSLILFIGATALAIENRLDIIDLEQGVKP